ncbi:hypothetical protein ABZW30_08140 [Kitasatospora sp. NPDC004669]|uniref:hypothetical protein n=1 Tax=Kitasatospora sp. NPDC004669 TaxID=3154555 RepID=UPI0033BD2CA1
MTKGFTLYDLPAPKPADAESADIFLRLEAAEDVLDLVGDQYCDVDDYLLFADRTGYLDSDMTVHAVHVHYVDAAGTFRMTTTAHPTTALAMAWLVEKGADAEDFLQGGHPGATPADAQSAAITRRIVTDPIRYHVVDHGVELSETWALLRDTDPRAAGAPYLLQIEAARDEGGYTLREGSFTSPQQAQAWLENRDRSLPPAVATDTVVQLSALASAARARSAATPFLHAAPGRQPEPTRVATAASAGAPRR